MDFISKFLAVVFSVLTALGIMPKNLPMPVILDNISAEEAVMSTEKHRIRAKESLPLFSSPVTALFMR